MKTLRHACAVYKGQVILVSTPRRMGSSSMTDYLLSRFQRDKTYFTSTSRNIMTVHHVWIDEYFKTFDICLAIQTKLGSYITLSSILEGLRLKVSILLDPSTVLKWQSDSYITNINRTPWTLALRESISRRMMLLRSTSRNTSFGNGKKDQEEKLDPRKSSTIRYHLK